MRIPDRYASPLLPLLFAAFSGASLPARAEGDVPPDVVAPEVPLVETAPPPPPEAGSGAPPDMTTATPALQSSASEPTPPPPPESGSPAPEEQLASESPVSSEPEPEREVAAPIVAEGTRAENMSASARRGHVPYYQTVRPAWGVQITGSLGALGKQDLVTAQGGNPTRAIQAHAEFQPPFIQALGVLGFGIQGGVYPIGAGVTANAASLWGVGGQVRYQARFFREQPLVPVVAYEYQRMTYRFANGPNGSLPLTGLSLGAMVLLNFLEPSAAAEFYIDQGVTRSYVVAEFKNLAGVDENVSIRGQSLFFGLRFEF